MDEIEVCITSRPPSATFHPYSPAQTTGCCKKALHNEEKRGNDERGGGEEREKENKREPHDEMRDSYTLLPFSLPLRKIVITGCRRVPCVTRWPRERRVRLVS